MQQRERSPKRGRSAVLLTGDKSAAARNQLLVATRCGARFVGRADGYMHDGYMHMASYSALRVLAPGDRRPADGPPALGAARG